MFFLKPILFLIVTISTIFNLHAAEIQGVVRSVNYKGHSFAMDLPPLQRVWIFPSTHFDGGIGYEGFQSIQEGNYVSIEGTLQKNGLFTAKTVKLISPVQNRKKSEGVNLNEAFTLGVNQKVKINGEKLTIKGVEMVDTLCKEGLYCEGEGSIGIRMIVSDGKSKKDLLLSSSGGRKPAKLIQLEAFGYQIQLIEVGESSAVLIVRRHFQTIEID